MEIMKKYSFLAICFSSLLLGSCNSGSVSTLQEEILFSLKYGNFEEQISIDDLNNVGEVRTGIAMRDGFFYIVDGKAEKTMELNSYGDLLSIFYNEDSKTAELINKSLKSADTVRQPLSFPFDYPGQIAVDSNKCIYAACSIGKNRQEIGEEGLVQNQLVLRYERDGSFSDYIGQQGPGGTPFPLINNIYVTQKDELVVICNADDGFIAYWFGKDSFLKYTAKINTENAPKLKGMDIKTETYMTIGNVIPSPTEYKLFVNIDYYANYLDEDSMIQSGVNYVQTLLYSLDCETETFGDPISIPPYEESVVVDYSRLSYKIAYDFLGITESGWKYFIVKTSDGFNIEMIQSENQKILRRHLNVNHDKNLYYTMCLSPTGIITALYLDNDNAKVVWYRTDNLIDAIIKN